MRLIILLSCFLITGCASNYLNLDVEFEARRHLDVELEARRHMVLAESIEDLSQFQDAIKEYTLICNKYPDTSYYKPAVWKLFLLNINPNNPDNDFLSTLKWLQIYSNLHLSKVEKETARIFTILIQQAILIQEEKEKLVLEIEQHKNKITSLTKKLSQTRTKALKYKTQLSILKKKLADTEDKLQKLKDIDMQMHKTIKNNSNTPG